MEQLKKLGLNAFIILCLAWLTVLLYNELPNFGVPVIYSRQVTTLLVFCFFAAVPFMRCVSSFRKLINHARI
jgi:hypothetical protein